VNLTTFDGFIAEGSLTSTVVEKCKSFRDRALTHLREQDDEFLYYIVSLMDACVQHSQKGKKQKYEARLQIFSGDISNSVEKSKKRGAAEMVKIKEEFYPVMINEFKPELIKMIAEKNAKEDKKLLAIINKLQSAVEGGQSVPGSLMLTDFWATLRQLPSQKFKNINDAVKKLNKMKPVVEAALDKSKLLSEKTRGSKKKRSFTIEVTDSTGYHDSVFTLNRETSEFCNADLLDLLMHEATPGHHTERVCGWCGSRRTKKKEPEFMKNLKLGRAFNNAFVEGWAHYVERFILDEPMFEQEYVAALGRRDFLFQKLGTYQWLLFRAARLIVDPVLNVVDEDEFAIGVMLDSGISRSFAETQVKRYRTEKPGQAVTYWNGAAKIHALRRVWVAGSYGDISQFHERILGCHGMISALESCTGIQILEDRPDGVETTMITLIGIVVFVLLMLLLRQCRLMHKKKMGTRESLMASLASFLKISAPESPPTMSVNSLKKSAPQGPSGNNLKKSAPQGPSVDNLKKSAPTCPQTMPANNVGQTQYPNIRKEIKRVNHPPMKDMKHVALNVSKETPMKNPTKQDNNLNAMKKATVLKKKKASSPSSLPKQ